MRKIAGILVMILVLTSCGSASSTTPPLQESPADSPTAASPSVVPTVTASPSSTPQASPEPEPKVWVDIYPAVQWSPPSPLNILVLGSDGRTYNPRRCSYSGRADVIHVVSINPEEGTGTILNFPRDSWVFVPPKGAYGRINEGLYYGGPEGMTATVERLTGIPIHYTVITTFCGLIRMVDAVGGLDIRVPSTMDTDPASGFGCAWGEGPGANERCSKDDIPESGDVIGHCEPPRIIREGLQRLDGCAVLKFARQRHGLPGGDFDRTTNQARVLLAGLKRFRELASTPAGLLNLLQIFKEHVRFNASCTGIVAITGCRDAIGLALLARTISPTGVESYTLRGSAGMAGEASVVFLSSSNAAIYRDVKTDAVINGR